MIQKRPLIAVNYFLHNFQEWQNENRRIASTKGSWSSVGLQLDEETKNGGQKNATA